MDIQPISLKPERRAELEEYARSHGQSPADALDELLAVQLEWQREEHEETVKAVMEGYEDIKAGRTIPAQIVMDELREKHGFPR